jgi:hypothetical protein
VKRHLTIYRNTPGAVAGASFYDWRKYLFEALARRLRRCGREVDVVDSETFRVQPADAVAMTIKIRDSLAILCDGDDEGYSVLDCHDFVETDELKFFVGDERCRKILKCQYRAAALKGPHYDKVVPWTYFDRFWPRKRSLLAASRKVVRGIDRMYFRGADWDRRGEILNELRRRGLTNPDFRTLDYSDYVREARNYSVMLSLPGMGDLCHRDIEWFGSGACVLRSRLENEFHDNLIADVHYVSVDVDYRNASAAVVADSIEKRFRGIVRDREYMEFVGANAARWYDANVRLDSAMDLTVRLLGLEERAHHPNVVGCADVSA